MSWESLPCGGDVSTFAHPHWCLAVSTHHSFNSLSLGVGVCPGAVPLREELGDMHKEAEKRGEQEP